MFRGGGHVNSRGWVWWAYAMLAVVAAVLIAASATLRETIDEPWAKPLSDVLQISTIFPLILVGAATSGDRHRCTLCHQPGRCAFYS